jgi:hypothetical protein
VAAGGGGAEDGGRLPPRPVPADTSEADRAWIADRRLAQPIEAFLQPLRLERGETALPRSYIYCLRHDPTDVFRPFYERAKREPGWSAHEIDASHNPHITTPETLAELLDRIA